MIGRAESTSGHLGPRARVARWAWRDHWPGALVLVVGLIVTTLAAAWSHTRALEQEQRGLARRAADLAASLRNALDLWQEVLAGAAALYDASDDVTEADFAAFARPAIARNRGLSALEWFPHVTDAARDEFEARGRRTRPDFAIREPNAAGALVPVPRRSEYLVLLYAEPQADSIPWGLDLYFESGRRTTADVARASGAVAVSPRLRLVEDAEGVYSIAMYQPVYAHGRPITSPAERRAAFAGVVVALLRLDDLATRAFTGLDVTDLEVALIDDDAPRDERILARRGELASDERSTWTVPMPFAGRAWHLEFSARAPGIFFGAPLILGVGLALSLLAAVALSAWRVVARWRRAVALAQRIGQYTLEERLGEGGMGVVYRARHAMLRRPTALKILKAEGPGAEAQLARFEREVQLTSQLTHPNTIVVFDYGRTPDRTFYYAMEYLDGIDLEALVEEHGAQPPARVVHVLAQAAGSLAEAHTVGLIHRDVKPANLILCHRGGVPDVIKVLDFGLVSTSLDSAQGGDLVGTPTYMSPEALRQQPLDARSDLYALGLIGYFLLTGERAVHGKTLVEVVHQHLSVTPPPPSSRAPHPVPASLDAIIMSCLAKDPAQRPSSAAVLRTQLLALADVPAWDLALAEAFWKDRATRPAGVRRATSPRHAAPFTVSLDGRR